MSYLSLPRHALGLLGACVCLTWTSLAQIEPDPGRTAPPNRSLNIPAAPMPTASLASNPGPRDPTVPGDALRNLLIEMADQASPAGTAGPHSSLVRIRVRGTGPNPAPEDVEAYRQLTPKERWVDSIELHQASFGEAARTLSQLTGLNLAPSAAAQAKIVSLYLQNLPAFQVLETLCNTHELWIRPDVDQSVLRIFTVQEFRRDLTSFRDEKTEVFTLLYPNAYDIANSIADLFGARVDIRFNDNDQILSAELQQRLDRFDLLDQRASGLTGTRGSDAGGGLPGGSGARGGWGASNSGNGFDSPIPQRTGRQNGDPERIQAQNSSLSADQIQEVANALVNGTNGATRDTAQIVESVQAATGRRVAIQVTVLRRQNKLLVRSADETAMKEIRELVLKLDVPIAMVLLDLRVLRVQLGDGLTRAFDYSLEDRQSNHDWSGSLARGEIKPPPYAPKFRDPITEEIITPSPNRNPGGSGFSPDNLMFQYLGSKLRARLELLESKNRIESVSNPTLLIANNEVSRVFVGEEIPITTGFTAGSAALNANGIAVGTAVVPRTEVRPVGTTLLLTPNINSDRTVTLRLVQETSSLRLGGATIPFPDGAGFRNFPVDVVNTRSISGTFIGKHSEAFLVGGLVEDENSVRQSGVPYLSRIPVLGAAFRRDQKSKGRTELVLICRPFVIATPTDAEAISRQVTQEIALNPRAWDLAGGRVGVNSYSTNDLSPEPTLRQKSRQLKADTRRPFLNPKSGR